MDKPQDPKAVLRANVEALMQAWYGRPNKSALGRDTGIEIGGAQRVLSGTTNVGVDLVSAIARHAGLQPWQLLVPELKPQQPPELAHRAPYLLNDGAVDLPAPANELERQLLQFFRGMREEHRDDLLALANRWYAQAQPLSPSPANPFPRKKRLSR